MRHVQLRCYGGKFDNTYQNVPDQPRVMIREDIKESYTDDIPDIELTMPPSYLYRQLRIFKKGYCIATILIEDRASDAEGLHLWKAVNERSES
jgi:hypothetical protein